MKELGVLGSLAVVSLACSPTSKAGGLDPAIERRIDQIMEGIDALPYDEMVRAKCDQLRPTNEWETSDVSFGGLTIPGFRYGDGTRGVGENTTPAANGYPAGKASSFPARINQSQTWNTDLVEQVSAAIGEESVASGVNVVLSASVDLVRDPRTGRVQETVGEDPYLAGMVGIASVAGVQSVGAIANVKHLNLNYIEQGRGMLLDIWFGHVNNYIIDQRTLIEHYGLPFKMAIQDGNALSVMAAYNEINGEKCTENYNLLTEILREQWEYRYWVISDWTANVSGYKAFNAGLDSDESMVFPSLYQQYLESDVRDGKITMEALDRSVRRVLRTKLASGIMDYYDRYEPIGLDAINSVQHQRLARRAALESIVLLKNDNGILPLDEAMYRTIAVVGPNAAGEDVLLGDASSGSSYVDAAYQVSVLDGISSRVAGGKVVSESGCSIKGDWLADPSLMSDALAAATDADITIFVGGINAEVEGEGKDRDQWTIELPGRQVELINRLKTETGKPVVVVLAGGGAMQVHDFVESADALLFAGYPGMEGGNAVADVLFGDYNPDAKLTMTFPYSDSQMPDFGAPGDEEFDFSGDLIEGVGYRYYDRKGLLPQYAFGYGLSYTTFAFSNLRINGELPSHPVSVDSQSLPVLVEVDVTNTGTREGGEVAQLYLSWDEACSVAMPVKQLKGFKKVWLAPNETATVRLWLRPDDLSFFDENSGEFIVEDGEFTVRVGNSSDNLPLVGRLEYRN